MDELFQIGSLCFRLIYPDELTPPAFFKLFACEGGEPAYTYEIALAQQFPQPRGRMIAQRRDIAVFEENGLEMRFLALPDGEGLYACYREEDETHASVFVVPAVLRLLTVDPLFLSLLCMERRMLACDSLILHCAYMQLGDKAILFSAPSGTGKTTQATLWEQHRGTRVVNGDKALLTKEAGAWTANGWPVCGSSHVCHNESMSIRAIVMLSQGKENTIARLTPFQAFSQLYSQITINFWNRQAQQRAMDLIEDLATNVPVVHLSCTISEEAVEMLEQELNR